MGRRKKINPIKSGEPIKFITIDDLTRNDKDGILIMFNRIKNLSSKIDEDSQIKEIIYMLDKFNLALARK